LVDGSDGPTVRAIVAAAWTDTGVSVVLTGGTVHYFKPSGVRDTT